MDEIGRNYLALALAIDRHFEGFVDAYFGPPELRAEAQAGEPRPLPALAAAAGELAAAVQAGDYNLQRKGFLALQIRAMSTVVRILAGEPIPFVDEVELYFDIRPAMVDEAVFQAAHAAMDGLLPGGGPLRDRLAAWRKGLEMPTECVLPVMERARQETRRRTAALFELPPGEDVDLQLVKEQPWSAYNWYLGGYRSRIDLNTDLPLRVSSAVPLLAHEAYPGHHTEHSLKEHLLYRGQGRAEHAVQLLLAPECVLSEGIADSAQEIILNDGELVALLRDELYPLAGLGGLDPEQQVWLGRAAEGLSGVSGNAALLLHRDGRSPEEVGLYLERWGLRTPAEAAQSLKFIQNPLFRSYIFNYASGKALLAPLLRGPQAAERFRRLLAEPLTPTAVRQLDFPR